MRGIAVYECARCGYQLNPVATAAFDLVAQSWGATELPVCPDRRDCYRRERDRVSRVPPMELPPPCFGPILEGFDVAADVVANTPTLAEIRARFLRKLAGRDDVAEVLPFGREDLDA